MPDASSGALAEQCGEFHGSWRVGASGCARVRQRGGQRNQRRNRAAACAEVSTVNFGTMTLPLAHLGRSHQDAPTRESWKSRSRSEELSGRSQRDKVIKPLWAFFLKSLEERALHLDGDVEVNDAQVVYPNDCFVPEVQHHHVSQLLVVEMDCWLSSSRLGPTDCRGINLIRQCSSAFCMLRTYTPSWLLELKQRDLAPPLVPLLP